MVQRWHPDKCKAEDSQRFRDIQKAYEVIGNAEKRKKYDQELDEKQRDYRGRHYSYYVNQNQNDGSSFSLLNIVLDVMFGDNLPHYSSSGADYGFEILLTPEEAESGVQIPLEFEIKTECSFCSGSGFMNDWEAICTNCFGTGKANEPVQISLDIPPQIVSNSVHSIPINERTNLRVRILVS